MTVSLLSNGRPLIERKRACEPCLERPRWMTLQNYTLL
nr:MAG TPA: hypothetical protein [Bacteriophage sp.]